ncbi:MAG: 50S ribosomal protein L29 [Xanthomonadales bacterium]|nr:50S ribosomal protein L29 [Xanthomonadales bacterium]
MKAVDLREKSVVELQVELDALLKKQFQNRMAHGTGQLPHTHELKQLRRNIARVQTVINEKTRSGESQ